MNDGPPPTAGFPSTCWGRVARAGDPDALAELCEAYWYPIYALIRRQGHDPDEALDLTQAYFARPIEKGTIAAADPGRGRFREFLRADCRFFLSHERARVRALRHRREPAHRATPEHLFEGDWAMALIDRAMARLERLYRAGGRGEVFRAPGPSLTAEPDAPRFDRLAAELGTTAGALRTALHRMRARFGEELRAEVAEVLEDPTPEAIAEELRDLFAALGSRAAEARIAP